MVEYRDIPNYQGYRVGNDGSVWSNVGNGRTQNGQWRKLKGKIEESGYESVKLCKDRKVKTFKVAHLVLFAFVGPRPDGFTACHCNGIRNDNRLENLRWDTFENNLADRKFHGTDPAGERNPNVKITADIVRLIRSLLPHASQSQIAKQFGISQTNVSSIARRKTWSEV